MSDTSEQRLPPGHVLHERYRIERLIGEGGMGAVYLGEHLDLGRKVAIKVMHADRATSDEDIERLRREARATAATGHRAIVDVIDINVADGSPYIVMELLEGVSLAELIDKRGTLDPAVAVNIVVEVLMGLDAVHAKGFIHRDLKPENIFLQRTIDGSEQVKILDFGISKRLDDEDGLSLTKTGTVLGTPYFMSPEQARGDTAIDHRVDFWALGVVLYYATTGLLPYTAKSYNVLIAKLLTEPHVSPREHNPAIPESLERVILKAMSRETETRYRSAGEFLIDLRQVKAKLQPVDFMLSQSDSVIKPSTPPAEGFESAGTISAQVITVEPRKRRWPVLAIAGVLMIAFVAGGLGLWFSRYRSSSSVIASATEPGPARDGVDQLIGAEPAKTPATETTSGRPTLETVIISFSDVPEGAKLVIGGEPIKGTDVVVPISDSALEVRVELEGQKVQTLEFVPSHSQTIPLGSLGPPQKRARQPLARIRQGSRPPTKAQRPEPTVDASAPVAEARDDRPEKLDNQEPVAESPTEEPAKESPTKGRNQFQGGKLPLAMDYDDKG